MLCLTRKLRYYVKNRKEKSFPIITLHVHGKLRIQQFCWMGPSKIIKSSCWPPQCLYIVIPGSLAPHLSSTGLFVVELSRVISPDPAMPACKPQWSTPVLWEAAADQPDVRRILVGYHTPVPWTSQGQAFLSFSFSSHRILKPHLTGTETKRCQGPAHSQSALSAALLALTAPQTTVRVLHPDTCRQRKPFCCWKE